MKVENTGVIFTGECTVKTEYCTARVSGVVSAVFTSPARLQVNVCGACFEEMLLSGAWIVPSARILPDQKERILAARREKELVPA